jgi:hypothetical protein
MRVKHKPLQVMVLLPSGRRHLIPQAATNLERSGEAELSAAPLPSISIRTILPLARLVQQLMQAKEESHAEQPLSIIDSPELCHSRSSNDLPAASPKPSAATRFSGRRSHSARTHGQTKQGEPS